MKRVQGIDLAVHGTKVAVYKTQPNREIKSKSKYNLKQLLVNEDQTINSHRDQSNISTYREVFKLKTARLSGSAVQTKLLQKIRESSEIEDLKKLLYLLGEDKSGDGTGVEVVASVDASKIYHDFYQVHYDFLRDVVERS